MKRKVTALLLTIALVAIMAMPASAGSITVDLDYSGETYTVSASCVATKATANIQTTCSTSTVSVVCVATDSAGNLIFGEGDEGTYWSSTTVIPAGNRTFVSAKGIYSVDGVTLTTITVVP